MPLLLFFVPYFNFPVCFLSLLFLLFLPFCLFPFLLLVFCSSAKPLLNPRTIRGFSYTKKGSDSCRSLFFRLRGSEGCFPDRSALGRRGLRSRGISFPTQWENQAASVSANAALFFRFMVFTTHHCRRLFQKVIRDESILTLFNHFVTSCRLNPRFREIFLFLYRFAFSPLINSESLSGSRSFCARISCAFYCADLTPSDLKAQSLRFRS